MAPSRHSHSYTNLSHHLDRSPHLSLSLSLSISLSLSLFSLDLVSITNRSENVPKWYRTIPDNAKRTISHCVFENRENLQNKSEPMGRNLLKEISIALLRIGEAFPTS